MVEEIVPARTVNKPGTSNLNIRDIYITYLIINVYIYICIILEDGAAVLRQAKDLQLIYTIKEVKTTFIGETNICVENPIVENYKTQKWVQPDSKTQDQCEV